MQQLPPSPPLDQSQDPVHGSAGNGSGHKQDIAKTSEIGQKPLIISEKQVRIGQNQSESQN
ncbi:hypothetical protein ES705_24896 [subsurface metagenome]